MAMGEPYTSIEFPNAKTMKVLTNTTIQNSLKWLIKLLQERAKDGFNSYVLKKQQLNSQQKTFLQEKGYIVVNNLQNNIKISW